MVFNSLLFVLFLGVVLLLHYLKLPWTLKKINLIWLSYLFYAAWYPPYVLLLWVTTVVDWYIARALAASENPAVRRCLLLASLVVNLGLLCFFKYGSLFVRTLLSLLAHVRLHPAIPEPNLLLPIGISFFVFMSLSYTIDIYQRRSRP